MTSLGPSEAAGSGAQINRYTWLGNLGDDYDNEDIFDSYYDLKPIQPNSVTFMPLSAETVASYDLGCHRAFGTPPTQYWGPTVVRPYRDSRNFYERAAQPFRIAHLLEDGTTTIPALIGQAVGFLDNGAGGAGIGAMLPPEFLARTRRVAPALHSLYAVAPPGMPANQPLANAHSWWGNSQELYIPSAGDVRPTSWGRDGIPYDNYTVAWAKNHYSPRGANWHTFTGSHPGADCVGVTTAKCTIGAAGSTSINFSCNQFLGVTMKATVTGGGVDLSIFKWLFTAGAAGISADDPSVSKEAQWGALSDNYYDFGTTALHVRLWEAWPHEQTLFDTRYFAVKHFNPGQRPGGGSASIVSAGFPTFTSNKNTPRKINVNSNCRFASPAVYCEVPTQAKPFNAQTGSYRHSYDKEDYSVDFRIPTYGPTPGTTGSPAGDFTYDNKIVAEGSIIGKNIALRVAGEWRVNPVRRGMLLPFNYRMRTIGLHSKSDSFVFNVVKDARERIQDPAPGASFGQTIPNPNYNTLKPHGGDGYQVGDTFVFYGGDGVVGSAKVEVKAIEYNQVNGLAGAIKYPAFDPVTGAGIGLEWVVDDNGQKMRGYGYSGTDFADLSQPASKDYGSIKLLAETVNGKDFVCYVRAGEVWDKTMTDAAPKEIQGAQRASLPSNNGQGNTGRPGPAIGTSRVGFAVNPDRGSYDAFLFFHNDIGHTIGNTTNIASLNSEQQWLTVDISAS